MIVRTKLDKVIVKMMMTGTDISKLYVRHVGMMYKCI